jgi:uncharacterized protein with PQ loop repeat
MYTYQMNIGQRHQSLRRKGDSSPEKRSKRLVTDVDVLVYIVSTLSLIFTTDQVRIIWIGHNVGGVSLLSWSFYTLSAVVWSFYGYIHKDKIIIITNSLWGVLSLIIVIGVMIYGR